MGDNRITPEFVDNWRRQHKLWNAAQDICELFDSEEIFFYFVKGPANARFYPHGIETRKFADLDVVVPFEEAQLALRLMREAGWEPKPTRWGVVSSKFVGQNWKYGHAISFMNGEVEIDLHWRPLWICPSPSVAFALQSEVETFVWNEVELPCLSAEATVFHTIVHALGADFRANQRAKQDVLNLLDVVGAEFKSEKFFDLVTLSGVGRAISDWWIHHIASIRPDWAESLGEIGKKSPYWRNLFLKLVSLPANASGVWNIPRVLYSGFHLNSDGKRLRSIWRTLTWYSPLFEGT